MENSSLINIEDVSAQYRRTVNIHQRGWQSRII